MYCDPTELRCLCPANYYWDLTLLTCIPQFTYNTACTSKRQCDGSLGLTCSSGSCQCKLFPGNWYWSTTAKYCIECPYDWTIINSANTAEQRCVKVYNFITSWYYAKINCEEHAAHLVELDETGINAQLYTLITVGTYYFVGKIKIS